MEGLPPLEKPQYKSAVEVVRNFVETQHMSRVPSQDPRVAGQVADYSLGLGQKMGYKIIDNPEEFRAVDEAFKAVTDRHGENFHDVARRYWDDPLEQERQRREIETLRRKHGHR